MIEFCTRRRMVASIVFLGVLTVLILILEEKFSLESRLSQSPTPLPNLEVQSSSSSSLSPKTLRQESGKECWNSEEFKVVVECAPCTVFEINSGSVRVCEETGLKETLNCISSGSTPVFRSCLTVTSAAKRRFWVFEACMLLLTVVSYGYCKYRRSQLERATIKKIEQRLASGL